MTFVEKSVIIILYIYQAQHNENYVVSISDAVLHRFLYYQAHVFDLAAMFGAGGDDIYSSSVDA